MLATQSAGTAGSSAAAITLLSSFAAVVIVGSIIGYMYYRHQNGKDRVQVLNLDRRQHRKPRNNVPAYHLNTSPARSPKRRPELKIQTNLEPIVEDREPSEEMVQTPQSLHQIVDLTEQNVNETTIANLKDTESKDNEGMKIQSPSGQGRKKTFQEAVKEQGMLRRMQDLINRRFKEKVEIQKKKIQAEQGIKDFVKEKFKPKQPEPTPDIYTAGTEQYDIFAKDFKEKMEREIKDRMAEHLRQQLRAKKGGNVQSIT